MSTATPKPEKTLCTIESFINCQYNWRFREEKKVVNSFDISNFNIVEMIATLKTKITNQKRIIKILKLQPQF